MKRFFFTFIALILVFFIAKDFLIQCVIGKLGSDAVGAPVEIGSFGWNFFTHKIHIRNLRVFNPPGFPHQPLIDIPVIDVDYDMSSLMKHKLHFPYFYVDIKEMVIVKNGRGKLNVDALKVSQRSAGQKLHQSSQATMPLLINVLKLSLEKTVYIDDTRANQPVVKVYDVGFSDKTFENVRSAQQLSVLILTQGMGPAAIKTAAIYGVAAILGTTVLPVEVVAILIGCDSDQEDYALNFDYIYDTALGLLKDTNQLVSENRLRGLIKGNIDGGNLTVQIQQMGNMVHVSASCRKFLIPRPELASGFIYQLSHRLK